MEISIDTRNVRKLQKDLKRLAGSSFTKKEQQRIGRKGAAVIRPILRQRAKKRIGNKVAFFYARGIPVYGAIPKNMSKTLNTLELRRMYGAALGSKMDNSNPSGTHVFTRTGRSVPVFGRTIGSSYASYAYIAYGGKQAWESKLLSPSVATGKAGAESAMGKLALNIYDKKLKRHGL